MVPFDPFRISFGFLSDPFRTSFGLLSDSFAGKSTLLSVLSGARRHAAGRVTRAGSRAYVAQPPFLQRESVRENITFGLRYDATRYAAAVARAALGTDLTQLAYGDLTNVGEGGVVLSGGQRARVAFARALYVSHPF